MNRKNFIGTATAATAGFAINLQAGARAPKKPDFDISLAQWSIRTFHRAKPGEDGYLDPLDFAAYAKNECGIAGIEYVNSFYFGKEGNKAYFAELKKRAEDEGVKSLLIMCDRCGMVGHPDAAERRKTLEKHKPWVDAAAQLGCHSIRVNAGSKGTFEEQQKLAADGLGLLAGYASPHGINVIVENHGGLSSNGKWLAGVMKRVGLPTVGTLPDFGNFRISKKPVEWYDRYQGMEEIMPFAKGVSAKSHAFDAEGNETKTDYFRMMKIVADAGYRGYIGVEWEGSAPGTTEGIMLTKALIGRAVAAL
ncbi:MAG: sugar phosphate isomerase/epimerase family protein [Verrucomicrobiota bacterium]|nr:sugar phosphate isomerase/epimerase family protein [Verrucomicrobiota bacterium]